MLRDLKLLPDTVPAFNYFQFRHFLQLMWFVHLMIFNISFSTFTPIGQSESYRYFGNGTKDYHIQGTLTWVIKQSLSFSPGCNLQARLTQTPQELQVGWVLPEAHSLMHAIFWLNPWLGTGFAFWLYRWLLSEPGGVWILCQFIQFTFWYTGRLGILWIPSGTVSKYYRANLLTFSSNILHSSASEEQSYFHRHFKSHYLILLLIFSSNKIKERLMGKQEFLVPWKQTFLL